MATLSAVVLARNEAAGLAATLATLAPWADDIVVLDGASTDGTAEVARRMGARVFVREPRGVIDEDRAFAVEQALGDWVLSIDADEVVPAKLARRLRETAERGDADVALVPKLNYFGDRPMELWFPNLYPLFFRKGKVAVTDRLHRFLQPIPGARVVRLPADRDAAIVHFSRESVSEYLAKSDRYTTIEAQQQVAAGVPVKGHLRLLAGCFIRVVKAYTRRRAGRDGWRGFWLVMAEQFDAVTVEAKKREILEGGVGPVREAHRRLEAEAAAGYADLGAADAAAR